MDGRRSPRRPDIQGLRAIAVLMVVAFHAGLPVPGGFVGVDVFFVISGFVITAMLERELIRTGQIRLGNFYMRRFKRLTPALALMVAATMVLTFLFLSPFGMQQTASRTAVGAMLLCANVVIAVSTGNYFDAAAETNPLLNTWSLSVEEQFYIVFPVAIFLGWKVLRTPAARRRFSFLLVSVIAVVSFALAILDSTGNSPGALVRILGFYSPVNRAWEFAVGALVALSSSRLNRIPSRYSLAMGLVGAALLSASLWVIRGDVPYPGVWTLLPVLGTVGLIVSGADSSHAISQFLRSGPMVRIGDWSYSIYLWHWPLIVIAVFIWPQFKLVPLGAVLVSLPIAYFSYSRVEQPLRSLPALSHARMARLFVLAVVAPIALSLVVGYAATAILQPRFRTALEEGGLSSDSAQATGGLGLDQRYFACVPAEVQSNVPVLDGVRQCLQSQSNSAVEVALLGDSHAQILFTGLADSLPDRNIAFYIAYTAPTDSLADSPQFMRLLDFVISSPTIEAVVLGSYWAQKGVDEDWLVPAMERLTASGKSVFVLDDVPDFPFSSEGCAYRKALLLSTPQCDQSAAKYRERRESYIDRLASAVERVPGAKLLTTVDYFCNQDVCSMAHQGQTLYADSNHLNKQGSRFLAGRMITDYPEFRAALEGSNTDSAKSK